MAKQAVASTQQNVPQKSYADDFAAYAGGGMENVSSADILIPRLTIIQGLSPQLKKNDSKYIANAAIGDICDVGTGDVYKEGVLFIPVYFSKVYIEWAPRQSGQGLVAIHTDPSILEQADRNDKNQPVLPNGNYIAETAQFFGFNLTADGRRVFIPMPSTQLKKARLLNTMAQSERLKRPDGSSFVPPLWYRCYQLTTAEESNNFGDWYGWKIERGPSLPELGEQGYDWQYLKNEAIEFSESLSKGKLRGDVESMQEETGDDKEVM